MPKLFYSIDGGREWIGAPEGLRVMVEELEIDTDPLKDTTKVDLLVNFTHEGIVRDVIATVDSTVLATAADMYDDIVYNLAACTNAEPLTE